MVKETRLRKYSELDIVGITHLFGVKNYIHEYFSASCAKPQQHLGRLTTCLAKPDRHPHLE